MIHPDSPSTLYSTFLSISIHIRRRLYEVDDSQPVFAVTNNDLVAGGMTVLNG